MANHQRHEEETNLLVKLLTSQSESVRPYMNTAVGIALLLGAALFAYFYFQGQRQQSASDGWRQFYTAVDFRDLEALEELGTTQTSGAGPWAMQTAGDLHLATGAELLMRNRELGMERLTQARDSYQAAFDRAESDMLRKRALLGMAQAQEALSDFDEAAETYNNFLEKWPEGALAEVAQDRLRLLENPSTQEFYVWLLEQKPRIPVQPNASGQSVRPAPQQGTTFSSGLLNSGGLTPPESTGPAADPNAKTFDQEFLEGLGGGKAQSGEMPKNEDATGDTGSAEDDDSAPKDDAE